MITFRDICYVLQLFVLSTPSRHRLRMLLTIAPSMRQNALQWIFALVLSARLTQGQADQQLLNDLGQDDAKGIPVYMWNALWNYPWYYTTLDAGEPAQQLTSFIDLQWSNLWIVSRDCSDDEDDDTSARYNANVSMTHASNGTEAHLCHLMNGGMQGIIASDTIALGTNVRFPAQPFIEVNHWLKESGPPGLGWDAGLGLSLSSNGSIYTGSLQNHGIPSIVERLLERAAPAGSQRPLFGLLLPRTEDSVGDLSFGHVNPAAYVGDLVSHPVHPPDTSSWSIRGPLVSTHSANGTLLFIHDLTNYTVHLDTMLPFHGALLPTTFLDAILPSMGTSLSNDGEIPCEMDRDALPTITFTFSSTQNITLTGRDYIFEQLDWFGNYIEHCRVTFTSPEGWDGEILNIGPDGILLGAMGFLQSVYTVFDAGERTVSCKSYLRFHLRSTL
nr:vacuolar protease a [Quercus suber]